MNRDEDEGRRLMTGCLWGVVASLVAWFALIVVLVLR